MKVYKIRDENGLYSTGGMWPSFTKSGKTWNNIGHLKNHLRQFFDRTAFRGNRAELYLNAEIIEVEIVETEIEKRPVSDLIIEMVKKDLEDAQEMATQYPHYAKQVVDIERQLTLMRAEINET